MQSLLSAANYLIWAATAPAVETRCVSASQHYGTSEGQLKIIFVTSKTAFPWSGVLAPDD